GLRAFLEDGGVADPDLHPMVRGRLTAINGAEVEAAEYEEPRARRLAEREWNLSQAADTGAGNRVVAGEWWSAPRVASGPWVSVEAGIAEALGIEVGDRVTYRIGGRELELLVTNLREVDWDSFRANFFAVTPPGVLADYPATWITAFRLPEGDEALLTELNRQFPSVTILDTGRILEQVRSITDRVALAVEYVFAFTLVAGLLLLYAALEATLDERRREGAILRALGASRGLLMRATLAEFATLGATAGLVAGLAASALGMALAVFAFDLPWQPAPGIVAIGVAAGAGGAALTGWLGARGVVREPPLAVLRRTGE
ncbi:MAG: ABC transporter permease, partial [Pseudomonadota bacterium]